MPIGTDWILIIYLCVCIPYPIAYLGCNADWVGGKNNQKKRDRQLDLLVTRCGHIGFDSTAMKRSGALVNGTDPSVGQTFGFDQVSRSTTGRDAREREREKEIHGIWSLPFFLSHFLLLLLYPSTTKGTWHGSSDTLSCKPCRRLWYHREGLPLLPMDQKWPSGLCCCAECCCCVGRNWFLFIFRFTFPHPARITMPSSIVYIRGGSRENRSESEEEETARRTFLFYLFLFFSGVRAITECRLRRLWPLAKDWLDIPRWYKQGASLRCH